MKDFGIFDETNTSNGNKRWFSDALPIMRVKRSKGADVRCRLVCKACYQDTVDKDDNYAGKLALIN